MSATCRPFNTSPSTITKWRHVKEILTEISEAPSDRWLDICNTFKEKYEKLPLDYLNQINPRVKESNKAGLNRLFSRAVLNFNANNPIKAQPALIFRDHYKKPLFLAPEIAIHLDIHPDKVIVTTALKLTRKSNDNSLILDCKDQKVLSVSINGTVLPKSAYSATKREIIIFQVPAESSFDVTTVCEINPYRNKSGAGMHQSGKHLTTQCESESASLIFPTLDRPDVMSVMTTTITADPNLYPLMISNGDLVKSTDLPDGRKTVVYHDNVPKSSYLFAAVLGNFDSVEGTFTTKKGRIVQLRILVEPGHRERAFFALKALKESMKREEEKFGRVYNHNTLTCVAMDEFNAGAMENTTLIIFNALRLLIDKNSGTDSQYRNIFHVILHEYCHNWRGNLVAIRDFSEVALKEAFTDWSSVVIEEDYFGEEYARIDQILQLQDRAIPMMKSEAGHPPIVNSYNDSFSIYDAITYIWTREIFRAMARYIETFVSGGARATLDHYFKTYKGKSVTFNELLTSANKILEPYGKNMDQFKEWFHQQGVPTVEAKFEQNKELGKAVIRLKQSNIHPKTKEAGAPLAIPFSYELIDKNGNVHTPRENLIFDKEELVIELDTSQEDLIPIFMHGYSAPVTLQFPYTLEQSALIALHSNDVYCRWKARQEYSVEAFKEAMDRSSKQNYDFSDLVSFYKKALHSDTLSLVAKSQLLTFPSLSQLAERLNCYDFQTLDGCRKAFVQQMTKHCESELLHLYHNIPQARVFEPSREQMGQRQIRNTCLQLLVALDPSGHGSTAWMQYLGNRKSVHTPSSNFTEAYGAFFALVVNNTNFKTQALQDFYHDWKTDKTVFNYWLMARVSGECTVDQLKEITMSFRIDDDQNVGYDATNPNHIRSLNATFIANSARFHDPKGEGYEYIVDEILRVGSFNPTVAHNYLFMPASIDFALLPEHQQHLFANQLVRLLGNDSPSQTREAAAKLLESYHNRFPKEGASS